MNETIAKAVSILRMSTDSDDDVVLNRLISSGMEPRLAARLVDFLPMAYARLLLERSGAVLPDFYLRLSPAGNLTQHSLDSEPAWGASIEFAKAEIATGTISSQDLLAIAARSAEFDAANNALNAGHALKDGVFSPCTLSWPEVFNITGVNDKSIHCWFRPNCVHSKVTPSGDLEIKLAKNVSVLS